MRKQQYNKLIPKLRFPEFKNEGEWEEKELGKILQSISNGLSIEQGKDENGYRVTRIETISNKVIDLEKVGYVVTDRDISEYKLAIGDILLSNINSLSHIGKAVLVDKDYNLYHGMNLLRLVIKNPNSSSFVFYQIDSDRVKKSIELRANKAVNQASINQTELKRTILFIPPNNKEQRKIAACLSSLDDVIKLESEKLTALRKHKKGLLQKLFPAEGKKVPELRFREFRKNGAWEEKKLGEVGEIITGNTPSTSEPENYGGGRLFVSPADINDNRFVTQTKTTLTELGFSKTRHIQENSVLFVCIGSTIGKTSQNKFECATNQQINSVVPNENYSSDFLYSVLENSASQIATLAGNQAVPIVNKSLFSSVKLFFPPTIKEQHLVASCLLSLDEIITAQVEKIKLLKNHKKGLMQGLFPED